MSTDFTFILDGFNKAIDTINSAVLSVFLRDNAAGDNEGGFLDPLHDVVATGMTPADRAAIRRLAWNETTPNQILPSTATPVIGLSARFKDY